jgi:adenosylhomocysteine nucleosidase
MPTQSAAPSGAPRAARIAVIGALAVERAGLDAPGEARGPIAFAQSGPGAERATAAARSAVAAGAGGLVSWGLAGGLVARLKAGDVVLPERIVTTLGGHYLVDASWRSRIAATLAAFAPCADPLVSAARVVATPAGKRDLARSSGAVAVDLESAAIAAVAREAGLPFVAVRVIADTHADTLPADVEKWIDAAGERRLLPLLGVALLPAQWGNLLALARRYRAARRTLVQIARYLAASDFGMPSSVLGRPG